MKRAWIMAAVLLACDPTPQELDAAVSGLNDFLSLHCGVGAYTYSRSTVRISHSFFHVTCDKFQRPVVVRCANIEHGVCMFYNYH